MVTLSIITDIIKQKNNPKRYSIFIDDSFFVGASDYIIAKYQLKIGMQVDPERMRNACLEDNIEKAKSYVLHYHLSKSRQAIRDKLREKGYEQEVIEAVLDFLATHQLTDDRKHAQTFTEQALHSKKYGKQKIKQKLKQKGIRAEDIDHVLQGVKKEEEVEVASQLVQTKLKTFQAKSSTVYECKQRIARFLMSRGFSHDVIQTVISSNRMLSNQEEWD